MNKIQTPFLLFLKIEIDYRVKLHTCIKCELGAIFLIIYKVTTLMSHLMYFLFKFTRNTSEDVLRITRETKA